MSIFTKVSVKRPPSNTFDLSHDKKLTFKIGRLVPVLCMDLVPGDRVNIQSASMVRFMPLVSPAMQRFDVYLHTFFVPNRILWSGWADFITGGVDGEDTTVPPYVELSSLNPGTVGDYLGLPTFESGTEDMQVSALPLAGYNKIFEEYYKDQNVYNFEQPDLADGLNDSTNFGGRSYLDGPFPRYYYKDYFTSALPWTQRGPEATIPLGSEAPIEFRRQDNGDVIPALIHTQNDGWGSAGTTWQVDLESVGQTQRYGNLTVDNGSGHDRATIDNSNSLFADLSTATASSINDLRRAFRLQEFLEKNARGGSRLTEVILSHFGVKSSDARLQRPEFIGGTKNPIQISEVLQTSSTDATSPQGNMAGHGIGVGSSGNMSYFAEEHGYLFTIMSVMPKASYMQGISRHWTRFDRLDYYWPSFAQIGEQPIKNQELYWDPNDGENEDTFGYAPRYAEYKYHPSTVHGEFRTTLDFWTGVRKFDSRPVLNNGFLQCYSTEYDRLFAVTDPAQDKLWCQVSHRIKARRPMPYFGTPTI